MINSIPVLGWLLSIVFNTSLAIPFWFFWTYLEIGKRYFSFLPEVYLGVGFWDCVGIFVVLSILRGFFPVLVSVSQTNKE